MTPRTVIYCHPATFAWLHDQMPSHALSYPEPSPTYRGVPVKTSLAIPAFARERRWVPPSGRYWECEQSDRVWCEPLGLGHWEEVETSERVFIEVVEPALPRKLEFFRYQPTIRGVHCGYN